ncbi:hypothetical protein PRK78_006411 [Emydomyces testavorans]|uniref:Uncharacterized protein n=1 Tax=Emydomyces testavorans TaxID=2070801 RepID=A0AAF0DMF5_9EURO|nr:hypothetical protein PRK78_006411 [Emydomyces testavorans]
MAPKGQGTSRLKNQGNPLKTERECSASTEAANHADMLCQTSKNAGSPIQSLRSKKSARMGLRQQVESRRYDITTLLNIGRQLESGKPPQAPNLDRIGCYGPKRNTSVGSRVLREKSMNHQRNCSTVSMSTDDGRESCRHPRRQPINAPQGTLAQSHAGFARFLKEHSSPKHHRVTAGGRIVPMVFQSPAPEFKLPVSAAETSRCAKDEKLSKQQEEKQPTDSETKPSSGNGLQRKPPSTSNSRAIPIKAPPPDSEQSRAASSPKTVSGVDGPTANQKVPRTSAPRVANQQIKIQPGRNAGQPAKLGPISFDGISIPHTFPAQSKENEQFEMFSLNSHLYPSQAIGPQLLSENMQQPVQLQYPSQIGNVFGMYTIGSTFPIAPSQSIPVNNKLVVNPYIGYSANHALPGSLYDSANGLLESAIQEYDNISNQLSNLDRYLALHTWDIDPATKKLLVEQRIELVRKLDSARVYKEHVEALLQPSKSEGPLGVSQISDQSLIANSNQGAQFPPPGMYGTLQSANNNSGFLPAGGYLHTGLNSTTGIAPPASLFSSDSLGSMLPGRPMATTTYAHAQLDTLNAGYENLQAVTGPNQAITAAQNWSINTDFGINNYLNFQNCVPRTVPTDAGKLKSEKHHVYEASTTTLPDFDMIYHKIEEAAKRKEPLEHYFRELARATASMNSMGTTHRTGQTQQSRDSSWASHWTGNYGGQDSTETKLGLRVLADKNLQVPEPQYSSGCNNKAGGSVATPQSKATIEGQQSKQSLSSLPGRQERGCTCARKREQLGNDSGSSGAGYQQSTALAEPSPGTHTLMPKSSRQPERSSDLRDTGAANPASTKTLGLLSSFDGTGESAGHISKPTTATTKVSPDATLMNGSNSTEITTGKRRSWFQRQTRKEPNPMDVRTFFHLLREEDREAIRKLEIDNPPF